MITPQPEKRDTLLSALYGPGLTAGEPLRRCLWLLALYQGEAVPPWRPKPLYGDPPAAPLTLAELHRGWRAILAEALGPAPAGFTPLAEAIQADAEEALAATARVIALLQEPTS